MKGRLFIFSGPSGVGKGTVRARVLADTDNMSYSVSCTTRKPRPGDREGIDYWFISKEDFLKQIEEGLFLEWADVHGNYYGTRRDIVEKTLDAGRDVMLEIDVQGALQIKKKMPEAITVFLMPPSFEELERRLRGRGTESEESLRTRLANAKTEIACEPEYDHTIVNDTVDRAVEEFEQLINSYRREQQ